MLLRKDKKLFRNGEVINHQYINFINKFSYGIIRSYELNRLRALFYRIKSDNYGFSYIAPNIYQYHFKNLSNGLSHGANSIYGYSINGKNATYQMKGKRKY